MDADTIGKAFKYACANDSRKIFRAKVNLIGHQGVGKSSVLRSLLGLPFVEEHYSTQGIDCKATKCHLHIAQSEDWKPLNKNRKEICKEDLNEQILERLKELSISEDQTEAMAEGEPNIETAWQQESIYVNMDSPVESPVMPPLYQNPHQPIDDSSVPDPDPELVYGTIGQFSRQQSRENQDQSVTKGKSTLQIGFWDYGGQIEYYATHHMFLDSDSINVLVLDITKDLSSPVETEQLGRFEDKGTTIPKNVIDFVHYWLNTIYTYIVHRARIRAEVYRGTADYPTVLVALTHKDQLDLDPDKRNLQIKNFVTKLLRSLDGKEYGRLISRSNVFCVDNKNGDPDEFEKLKGAIIDSAKKKIGWELSIPVRWLQLETLLYKEAQKLNRNVVPIQKAEELATTFLITSEEFKDFVTFYHAMGDILHFPDLDSNKYLITSPQWLIEIFASIIRYPSSESSDGREPEDVKQLEESGVVDEDLLFCLWQKFEIELDFLSKLMCKFDLMIPVPGDEEASAMPGTTYIPQYLIPCMLPVCDLDEMNSVLKKDSGMNLIAAPLYFKSKDNFIPIGTFQRLLCHCSKNPGWRIHGKIYYNAGTFLTNQDNDILVRLTCHDIAIKVECRSSSPTPSANYYKVLYEANAAIQQSLTALSMSAHFATFLFPCEEKDYPFSEGCLVATKEIIPTEASQNQRHSSYRNAICKMHLITLLPEKYASWFTGKPFPRPRAVPQVDEKFLHATSRAVASDANLTDLGIHLGLQHYEVGAIRTDHKESIQEAAFHLLLHWYTLSSQEDTHFRQDFMEKLKHAFEECEIPWPLEEY